MEKARRAAIIIVASSGIGEALARVLNDKVWRLGLAARRLDKLNELASQLSPTVATACIDVSQAGAVTKMEALAAILGGADLIIISAGTGYLNPELDHTLDRETVSVNVVGLMEMASGAIH